MSEEPDFEGTRILPTSKSRPPEDWKELFQEDLDGFDQGVELRASATLPSGRTLPRLREQTTDAFTHWEKTAPWRYKKQYKGQSKSEKNLKSFSRRSWEAATLVQGALENGKPENVFQGSFCDQHPSNVAWWWAMHGCEKCKLTQEAKMLFFSSRVTHKERQRFPGFALQNPSLQNTAKEMKEEFPELPFASEPALAHPLLRPASPFAEEPGRKRTEAEKRNRDKRHSYIVQKYPYRQSKLGTDSNPKHFTYQWLKTAPDRRDLARKHTRPPVPWH
ncbi:unnamed protein product [Amoebophrya sp. A120]|nr:unnamed protein product [Amoebophrya sp. A120]|eukprot:GSA120T00016464001.1